jgi:hypothetical protein
MDDSHLRKLSEKGIVEELVGSVDGILHGGTQQVDLIRFDLARGNVHVNVGGKLQGRFLHCLEIFQGPPHTDITDEYLRFMAVNTSDRTGDPKRFDPDS